MGAIPGPRPHARPSFSRIDAAGRPKCAANPNRSDHPVPFVDGDPAHADVLRWHTGVAAAGRRIRAPARPARIPFRSWTLRLYR